jgi:hypothetical protein
LLKKKKHYLINFLLCWLYSYTLLYRQVLFVYGYSMIKFDYKEHDKKEEVDFGVDVLGG